LNFNLPVFSVTGEQRGIQLKNITFLIIFAFLASGCANLPFQLPGVASPATQTPIPLPTATEIRATEVPTAAPSATVLPSPKNDPVKALTIFLDGQKGGAPFALTSNLLSSSLASVVKDDSALKTMLGAPESIGEFKIGSPAFSNDLQSSILETTVYTPEPSNIRFSMVVENGEWKIAEIKVLTGAVDYPATPENVVLSFLAAYQEAPDRMSNYLTSTRRAAQPPGGAAAMLQISGGLEGMVIQSAAVNPEPASASIKVLIRAGGKDFPRTFLLTKDNTNWGIEAIEVTSN
jgi:hypothetical protein